MSGKESIKRRLDDIEEGLAVGDDYVDVQLKFDESMWPEDHTPEPIILRMKRSKAELLKWELEKKGRKTEDEEADDEPA